jgi:hypothetical protein
MFEVGDKIHYVHVGAVGWESVDWAFLDGLVPGETYTVMETRLEKSPAICVEEGKDDLAIHPDHFLKSKSSDEARHRAARLINNCMDYGAVDDLEKAREELDFAIELMMEETDD